MRPRRKTNGQAILERIVSQVVDCAFFALGYLLATDMWHANPAFAAGFGVVVALSQPVTA